MTDTTDSKVEEFRSDDIPLIAWLRMQEFEPIGMRVEGRSFHIWVFADSDELRDAVDVYLSEEALVEPRRYSIILRETYRELNGAKGRGSRRQRSAS